MESKYRKDQTRRFVEYKRLKRVRKQSVFQLEDKEAAFRNVAGTTGNTVPGEKSGETWEELRKQTMKLLYRDVFGMITNYIPLILFIVSLILTVIAVKKLSGDIDFSMMLNA